MNSALVKNLAQDVQCAKHTSINKFILALFKELDVVLSAKQKKIVKKSFKEGESFQ